MGTRWPRRVSSADGDEGVAAPVTIVFREIESGRLIRRAITRGAGEGFAPDYSRTGVRFNVARAKG